MDRRTLILTLALGLASHGCGETGQEEVSYPLFASGNAESSFVTGDYEVTLEVARIGFGPAYFCATSGASSDLCPSAMAEFTASATVDGLAEGAQQLGEIRGVTGEIRSATYDYAFNWFATQRSAAPGAGAPGGHSAHFEGRVVRGTTQFRFVADIDVVPQIQGSRAVQGARISADVQDDRVRLDVRFDPTAWWRSVDFSELEAIGGELVVVPKGSRAANAVIIGMTATTPPTFEWSESP